jgi:hypothetical protein
VSAGAVSFARIKQRSKDLQQWRATHRAEAFEEAASALRQACVRTSGEVNSNGFSTRTGFTVGRAEDGALICVVRFGPDQRHPSPYYAGTARAMPRAETVDTVYDGTPEMAELLIEMMGAPATTRP